MVRYEHTLALILKISVFVLMPFGFEEVGATSLKYSAATSQKGLVQFPFLAF